MRLAMAARSWVIALGLLLGPVTVRADAPKPAVSRPQTIPLGEPSPVQGICNLNTASQTELELLPGIGPVKAKAILAFRQRQPFRTIEDLVKVKGIGRKTLGRLRSHLAVNGTTTLSKKKGGGNN